jgi:cell fate regulator YaaT (PSP1 superfamily)
MGCGGSCGSHKTGELPTGCKDHGSCKSGGCNRLNVHDWLSLIPVAEFSKPFPFIEVSFNHGSRKDYFKTSNPLVYEKGDFITVEGSNGYDVGVVNVTGELVKLQMKKKGVSEKSDDIKRVLHPSTDDEISRLHENKKQEKEMMVRARVIARDLKLQMKIAEVEVQADGKKATFFYSADDRVDFRELIKIFAMDFRIKVEMRQIGIRQEAAKVGGIGSCGRELCCSTWLNDFKSVSTTAARYQNLSINQTKLSGQCGRLKCCLNYELDTYMDALRVFPDQAEKLKMKNGVAYLNKKDIFKNLMWYSFEKSNTLYPLTIERVKEIQELNRAGSYPEDLQAVEVVKKTAIAEKTDFVDVVGQFSLKGLERASKKKKQKAKEQSNPTQLQKPQPSGQNSSPNQGNKPNPNQAKKSNPNLVKPNLNPNQVDKTPQPKPQVEGSIESQSNVSNPNPNKKKSWNKNKKQNPKPTMQKPKVD